LLRRLICFGLLFGCIQSLIAQERKYSFSKEKMGSPFNLILVSDDSVKAAFMANACFRLIDSFNLIFSDYDEKSELSQIHRQAGIQPIQISPAMQELLLASKRAYQQSKGSYDISIGPLSQLWRKARKTKIFPPQEDVSTAKSLVGFSKISIDSMHHTLHLPNGMRLDFGGIAKGYIAQKVIDFLRSAGIKQALADAGGDIVLSEPLTKNAGWIVGVNIPEQTDDLLPRQLLLKNMAVATSGDAYQFITHAGKKYSHIIDPQTGYGVNVQRNVTVIAKDGTEADWLATACSILPLSQAKRLAVKMNASLLITEIKDNKIQYHKAGEFDKYWKPL
jgi:thiamine biosynthesis lipoprotein